MLDCRWYVAVYSHSDLESCLGKCWPLFKVAGFLDICRNNVVWDRSLVLEWCLTIERGQPETSCGKGEVNWDVTLDPFLNDKTKLCWVGVAKAYISDYYRDWESRPNAYNNRQKCASSERNSKFHIVLLEFKVRPWVLRWIPRYESIRDDMLIICYNMWVDMLYIVVDIWDDMSIV